MAISIIVHPGSDDAFTAWSSAFIAGCRGFALYRRIRRGPDSPSTQAASAAFRTDLPAGPVRSASSSRWKGR